jgi:hypothetical protein
MLAVIIVYAIFSRYPASPAFSFIGWGKTGAVIYQATKVVVLQLARAGRTRLLIRWIRSVVSLAQLQFVTHDIECTG